MEESNRRSNFSELAHQFIADAEKSKRIVYIPVTRSSLNSTEKRD